MERNNSFSEESETPENLIVFQNGGRKYIIVIRYQFSMNIVDQTRRFMRMTEKLPQMVFFVTLLINKFWIRLHSKQTCILHSKDLHSNQLMQEKLRHL